MKKVLFVLLFVSLIFSASPVLAGTNESGLLEKMSVIDNNVVLEDPEGFHFYSGDQVTQSGLLGYQYEREQWDKGPF